MAASGIASRSGRLPALAKYEVIEEIGHGGMATVYRAHDPRLARDVAVKVIHPHLRDSQEAKTRFQVEARAVAKLRHPNIVEVFDVSGEGEGEQYLVVELVRGVTLRKLLQERKVLPPEVAACLGVEVTAALAHAHAAGVIHRDIKPENVMLEHQRGARAREPGDRAHVKLTDFGIAKLLDAQGVTSTGQVLGSPAHMAPEQIEGGDIDARADVFGLGVLLYECMVGHLPFEGNNPAQVLRRVLEGVYPSAERERPQVGKRWSALLDRALARAPEGRFVDASTMRDALASELRLVGVTSPRAELERWLDDPGGYERAHDAALIATLCDLGRDARARGDALDAAAHFNRALAYAPHDPQLLKVVASMHRTQAWRRLGARALPLALACLAAGGGSFYVGRSLRARARGVATTASPSSVPPPTPPAAISAAPAPSAPPAAPPVPTFVRAPPPAAKPVKRSVVLGSVQPPFGVLVALDGEALGEASQGLTILIDGKPHELRFTCTRDECSPVVRGIAAGDEAQIPVDVSLPLRPATLYIDGPDGDYAIEENPGLAVAPNSGVKVPVTRGTYPVHVVERRSGVRKGVVLHPAQTARVDFVSAPP